MGNAFTIDGIRDAAVNRYAPISITLADGTDVELKKLLKLREKDRKAVLDLIEDIKNIDEDDTEEDDEKVAEIATLVCETIAGIIRIICSSPRKLLAELEHDDVEIKASMYTSVLTNWLGQTQLGEAEPSPS